MMGANLTSELHGRVWSVGIDRPEKRNALNGPLFEALANNLRLAHGEKLALPRCWPGGWANCALASGS
jgi:enoyl-CoA hydratase/carnithine racemase